VETFSYQSESTEQSLKIAADFAQRLKGGEVIALIGELGAGKTVFAKGLCSGLGCDQLVSSPSFTLINVYRGRFKISHVDCYRLNDPHEIDDLGPNELLYPEGITIIEWAEKIKDYLPENKWVIRISMLSENGRRLEFFKDVWPD
jgi:tRNA threonylcarbamoyladenosine biosynthesis protein TsaE